MDDKNKQSNKQASNKAGKPDGAPESITGATPAKSSTWKRLLAKKWVYPAVYIAAVAIILTLMWVYQGSDTNVLEEEGTNLSEMNGEAVQGESNLGTTGDAIPVTVINEKMQWPVEDFDQIEVMMTFYDSEASNEAKQAATIQYGDMFIPSIGISLSRQDNETFNVIAALDGTVTRVEQIPLIGHQVEITHSDGLKTVYQSLADVTVSMDEEIKQGDIIAQAGRNELEKDLGVHLHFEVHQDGHPVNPETFIAES